jgi:RecJ-like exonuclease
MKFLLSTLLVIFLYANCCSQSLDSNITFLANDLAQKVSKKNRVKLAVADFVNGNKKIDPLTNYIREELEAKLINSNYDLQMMDRKHLQLLLAEHNLLSEGVIDESTAKAAIEFIQINGWVTAEISSTGDRIKIKISVIDISTAAIYAVSSTALIKDDLINNLLEPEAPICSQCKGSGTIQITTSCSYCNGKGNTACQDCKGTGQKEGMTRGSYLKCENCNGRGKLTCGACNAQGKSITFQTCPKCNGKVRKTAEAKNDLCIECNGLGKLKEEINCAECGGTGKMPFGPRSNWENKACPNCAGKGKLITSKSCMKCQGKGTISN